MKMYFYFILISIINTIATAQVINIPDANFKALLLAANPNNSIAAIGSLVPNTLTTTKIDANDNGEIEVNEVQNITYLLAQYSNISDLTGIEYFINLKYFFCNNNNLISINNTIGLTHLERMFCNQNQLTSINLSNFTGLRILGCSNNQISTLDFLNNPILVQVYCGNNQLTSLDFSNNPLFNDLGCKNNPNLNSLKIKNNTIQLFGAQTIYNECWTGLPSLNHICADANEINALQTYLAGCGINTSGIVIDSNCVLGNEQYNLNEVVVYPNPATSTININSNVNIKKVELIDMQGRKLVSKVVNASEATLDIAGYGNGVYFIKVVGDGGSRIEKIIKE